MMKDYCEIDRGARGELRAAERDHENGWNMATMRRASEKATCDVLGVQGTPLALCLMRRGAWG